MEIKAVDFSYSNEITVISKKQFDVHKKLYGGYISKANEICHKMKNDEITSGNATYSEYRALGKGQSYALDGVILHELYFKNIGGVKQKPGSNLLYGINEFFGNYNKWLRDFKACAESARGWAILAYEQRSRSLVNMLLDTHDEGIITGSFPIIVLDMYEHAYFIDYANNKDEYFDKFIENVRWSAVDKRFEAVFLKNQED